MTRLVSLLLVMVGVCLGAQVPPAPARAPHVVFVTGDDEYRSEITMPMIAAILEKTHGITTTIAYARPKPQTKDNIEGLEALDTADLLVMFTRFRALPEGQLQHILRFIESGKPIVGLRTSTHKYVRWETGKEEVYDLRSDPGERVDLAGNGSTIAPLRAMMDGFEATRGDRSTAPVRPSGATREALRALGYVR